MQLYSKQHRYRQDISATICLICDTIITQNQFDIDFIAFDTPLTYWFSDIVTTKLGQLPIKQYHTGYAST